METDSSIGYRDRIGFRAGTGFPFHLYNFEDEKPYSWKEIPLVLMDVAWLREGKYKQEKMRHILHRLKMASAHLTDRKMLFHNTIFYEQELGGLPLWDLYRESLQ